MRLIGLFIGVSVGILLILVSKWFLLVNVLLVPYIMTFFMKELFKCPKCSFVQRNHTIMNITTDSQMVHGRVTKSGRLDQRFKSRFASSETIDFGTECTKCGNTYKTTRTYWK
jgi:hypothetical protein